ncbi:MAG: VWA domain-containing protein [Candidatus Aminicenantes bacterium]|nr:VWA domain-containing protein [Candidatus Aminicenantes bacterium]
MRVLKDFSDNQEDLKQSLLAIKADGGTALYDSILKGIDHVENKEGMRAVVVLTDGKDENARRDGPGSTISFEKLKKKLALSHVPVFCICLGEGVERNILETVAQVSHGDSFFISNAQDVDQVYNDIITYAHFLYRFYYITKNGQPDGTVLFTQDFNLFAVNSVWGPKVYDPQGVLIFEKKLEQKIMDSDQGQGIAVADNGNFVYSVMNRVYSDKITEK